MQGRQDFNRGGRPGGGGRPHQGGGRQEETVKEGVEKLLRASDTVTYWGKTNAPDKPAPRAELFGDEAEAVARQLGNLPPAQLRRFYGGVTAIKRRLETDRELGLDFIRSELAILKAQAAYAVARLGNRWQDGAALVELLNRHGRSIASRDDFLVFARHFEAVMAFHKVFEQKQGRG